MRSAERGLIRLHPKIYLITPIKFGPTSSDTVHNVWASTCFGSLGSPVLRMAKNLFSVPIFFIVFRETVEAAIIISVLLGLTHQIVTRASSRVPSTVVTESSNQESDENDPAERTRLLKKMKLQVRYCRQTIIVADNER